MKLFVWDFHGVLEKGNDFAVIEITNLVLKEKGFSRELTELEAMHLSGKRWHEYYAYLLPGLDEEDYFQLQAASVDISSKHPDIIAKHIQLNDNAHHVLDAIANSRHTQIVISNTQTHALDIFLKFVNIEHFFPATHRFAVDSHTREHKTKKDYLEHFLMDRDFPAGIVSIGDSPHDVALVHNRPNGVGYLYTHPNRQHRQAECHYKIHNLREVLREV